MLKTSPSYCPVGDLLGTNLFSISLGSCYGGLLPAELHIGDCWHLLAAAVLTSGPHFQDCCALCYHWVNCKRTGLRTWDSQVTALMRTSRSLLCFLRGGGVSQNFAGVRQIEVWWNGVNVCSILVQSDTAHKPSENLHLLSQCLSFSKRCKESQSPWQPVIRNLRPFWVGNDTSLNFFLQDFSSWGAIRETCCLL